MFLKDFTYSFPVGENLSSQERPTEVDLIAFLDIKLNCKSLILGSIKLQNFRDRRKQENIQSLKRFSCGPQVINEEARFAVDGYIIMSYASFT